MSKGRRRGGARHGVLNWAIQLRSWPRQLLAILLILGTCGALVYRAWPNFAAAWITRNSAPDPAVYERAIKYDAGNADYHFILAQLYNYRTEYLNLDRARDEYEAAARLNPERATHWIELAKYYEQARSIATSPIEKERAYERSRAAMKMALEKDPNYAQTHWSAANMYVRLGDLSAADFELRRAADLDVMYLAPVLDLVWRFYEDPQRIMSNHVPNTKAANLTALAYFLSQQNERGAALAWNRLKEFESKPKERFQYVEYLVRLNKPHDAWDVFSYPTSGSSFFNSSFESEALNGGFDWRISSSPAAEARRDTRTAKDGDASLLVTFTGKENVDYSQAWHWLPVTRGKTYQLTFWMKTEAISTSEGMYVQVDGQTSEKQIGTTDWKKFAIRFTASSDLATVNLRRVPTRKFDSLLKGKVWLDGFDLSESRGEGAKSLSE